MKSLIFKSGLLATALLLFLSFTSCQKDAALASDNGAGVAAGVIDIDEGDVTHNEGVGFESSIQKQIDGQSVFLDNIEEVEMVRPDGSVDQVYLVDGDIELTKSQLQEIREDNNSSIKQYRTNNLVTNNQTISVIGYTGGGYALTTKMRTGLSWAIANYNSLNIGLSFTLSFQTSTNADIVVYKYGSGAGGSAGFPSNGNPYKWVQIRSGMDSYSYNVNEHVVGHEIGHCLGMRHTDYFSRASCGQNSNEGSAGVGAIHIPNTPTGIDWNSLMLACFSSSEDGEFGFYDRVALEYLY